MGARLRKLWPAVKAILAVVIVAVVGRRFYLDLRDHPDLWSRAPEPLALVGAGLLYALGLGFSALCWYRLMRSLGQTPFLPQTFRAYFLGQLGKYVPGKAYSLVLRADLARRPGVAGGLAGLTAFYEVFVTMASGALVAALLFAVVLPSPTASPDWSRLVALVKGQADADAPLDRTLAVAFALVLLTPLLLVTFPPLFNRLAHRASLPFRKRDEPLPMISYRAWLEGLLLTSGCWLCLGASLALVLRLDAHFPVAVAVMSAVYVGAFLVLVVPGALGVREYFLMVFLVAAPGLLPPDSDATHQAQLTAALLRVAWTAAELLVAALVWPLPRPPREEAAS